MKNYHRFASGVGTLGSMPRWSRYVIRVYTLLLLVGLIPASIYLTSELAEQSGNIIWWFGLNGVYIDEFTAPIFIFLSAIPLLLYVIILVGFFKLQRWVLPILILVLFELILFGYLTVLPHATNEYLIVFGILFVPTFIAEIVGVIRWNYFHGSAANPMVQIPCFLILLLPVALYFLDDILASSVAHYVQDTVSGWLIK